MLGGAMRRPDRERLYSNRRPCIRRFATAFATGVLAAAVLAGLVLSQPGAGQTARAASVVPEGLLTDLVKLDRKLAKLIHEERTKGLDVFELHRRVERITHAKQAMVDQFFDQPVYGVKYSEVFNQLDCLDRNLELGYGLHNG